jgi:hypothetical protein
MAETVAAVKTPARNAGARQKRRHLAANYEVTKLACAAIILRDALHYGGGESLMVTWACAVVEGRKVEQRTWRLVA